ncbi:MAG: vitamin B12 receptor [bacterium P3]|nr:MAG: vitamin B12 receptor [bacterium P3]KWW42392.1 MAG: vitamin B12 receptor [bacterium F083]
MKKAYRVISHYGHRAVWAATAPGVLFCLLLVSPALLCAQSHDTLRRERLQEVEISAQRTPATLRVATPTQVVTIEKMQQSGTLQLSDAVKQLAGVTLKDYGGIGGMKTVSARGLGSQFSAVTLDGIPVDDTQNGQVDLGRYLVGNSSHVSFSQGQQSSPLLSARAYAAGNVLNMETAVPRFAYDERTKMKMALEGGSYGLLSPTLLWEQRWGRRLRSSFWANCLHSDGDYPFTQYYTSSHQDSSSVERRKHSAVNLYTVDGNLFHALGRGHTLTTKLHYFKGDYEIPGAVSLYSNVISGQRSEEELAFAQTRWRIERDRWSAQLSGKIRYSHDHYLDTTAGNQISDTYRQGEAYLSGSLHRTVTHWIDVDAAVDEDISHLNSDQTQRNKVTRQHLCAALSLRLHNNRFEAQANALYTDVTDRLNDLDTTPCWRRLTPSLSLLYKIDETTTLRVFYKETYRAPNFSELYFFQLVPHNLKPEQAHQVNIGLTYAFADTTGLFSGQLTVDGYYNRVNDKIIARPTVSLYYWSMQNLGIVDILGLDAVLQCRIADITIHGNYSFQSAIDHTDRNSAAYGYQIVYIPRHSGGADLRWENRWVNLGGSVMATGRRYSNPLNSSETRLPAYCEVAIHADRSFHLKQGTVTLRASVHNLLDTQYEIVASYPMMGRNWKLGITYVFNKKQL